MKIFISYSREDAVNFAKHIHRYMRNKGHDVFIDVNDIKIGETWADSIEKNISECDIFVVILTPDALSSSYVESEVLQAQRKKKIIVPCMHEYINYNEIKWGLDKIQGIEFLNEYQLVLNLYQRIKTYEDIKKPIYDISESFSKIVETRSSDVTPSTSNTDRLEEQKEFPHPLKKKLKIKTSQKIQTILQNLLLQKENKNLLTKIILRKLYI